MSQKFFLKATLALISAITLISCQESLRHDPVELTRYRLEQMGHFLTLLKEQDDLPATATAQELSLVIYQHYSTSLHDFQKEISYYETNLGFLDAWGRPMKLMHHEGYRFYSFGANGLDDWGDGDDLQSSRTVLKN